LDRIHFTGKFFDCAERGWLEFFVLTIFRMYELGSTR